MGKISKLHYVVLEKIMLRENSRTKDVDWVIKCLRFFLGGGVSPKLSTIN